MAQEGTLIWMSQDSSFTGVSGHGSGLSRKIVWCVINSSHISVGEIFGLGWSDKGRYFFLQPPGAVVQQDPAICHKPFHESQQSRM
jgi:hypothetical protein